MTPAEPLTLSWLLDKAWLLLVGIMWYGKKNLDKNNEARDAAIQRLEKEVVEAKATYITETQMRETIRQALEPYKEDQQEIKLLLRGLTDQINTLGRDMAVQNAVRSINDQQGTVGR